MEGRERMGWDVQSIREGMEMVGQAPGSASVTTLPRGSLILRDFGRSTGRLKILG